jgi:amino acid transporter
VGETLQLKEAVAMSLGGMIGGGIYAVLGVVTQITGAATWFAFLLAGIVAACASYSYNKLNELSHDGGDDIANESGGAVTFIQSFTGNSTLAGMTGWTLLIGYIGSMAMYAFAFAEFAIALDGIPGSLGGIPLRPVISVLAVAGFVTLNLVGARVTGTSEDVLVAAKILILIAFGIGGILYVLYASPDPMHLGFGKLMSFGPIMAGAISFVAFQGWQLLFYEQGSISNPLDNLPKAIYLSIPVAMFIYIIVSVATYNLAPQAIQHHPHTALTQAAATIAGYFGLAGLGAFVLALSALFSTGSAINATLFSSGHYAKGMLSENLLPDQIGDSSASSAPTKTVLIIGILTAAFTAYGSLSAITSFASLTFIIVFGGVSYLAFGQRNANDVDIRTSVPVIGTVGSVFFLVLMFYHLYSAQRNTFYAVLIIAAVVFLVEILYFERDYLEQEINDIEDIASGGESGN